MVKRKTEVVSKPEMTLDDVHGAVERVLKLLRLGVGSWRRGGAFDDYVTLQIACFDGADVVRSVFGKLCHDHGWLVCNVQPEKSVINVTLQKTTVVMTGSSKLRNRHQPMQGEGDGQSL